MKVKAIQTFNGLTAGGVVAFVAGQSYDIDEGSANDLQRGGYLETVSPSKVFAVEQREEIASEPAPPTADEPQTERVDWTKCKGVSTEIAAALYYMGLNTKDDLLTFFQSNGISALTDIPGVGMKRAKDLISFSQKGY
jgi:hypothetical protein